MVRTQMEFGPAFLKIMKIKKWLLFFILFLPLCTVQLLPTKGQNISDAHQADTSIQQQTVISGHMVTGKMITLTYHTLPNNNPLKNKNWVAIWQGSQILYDTPPLHKAFIPGTSSSGDFAFDSLALQKKEYIMGYGNGNQTSTVSATLYFKAEAQFFDAGLAFATQLKVIERADNYLVINFTTPLGNIPLKNSNWIGVWTGQSFQNNGSNLIKRENVNSVVSEDTIAINNLQLIRGEWYTITYGIGPAFSEIVASTTFINH